MAYLVARKDGRYEIRESSATPSGPRSRTLASFRALDASVLDDAAVRARRPFRRDAIVARAAELGVPRNDPASVTARRLLGLLRRRRNLPPVLARLLRDELPPGANELPDSIDSVVEWLGVSADKRGLALRDLLQLASILPQRRRPDSSAFPRINSAH